MSCVGRVGEVLSELWDVMGPLVIDEERAFLMIWTRKVCEYLGNFYDTKGEG